MSGPLIIYNYNELGEPNQYIRFISKSRSLYRTSFINNRYNQCFDLLDSYIQKCLKENTEISEISVIEYARFGFEIFESTFEINEQESIPKKFINREDKIEISEYLKYINIIKSSKMLILDKHNWRKQNANNVDLAILLLNVHFRDYGIEKFEAVFGLIIKRIKLEQFIEKIHEAELDYLMDNLTIVEHLFVIEKKCFVIYLACDKDYHFIIHDVFYKN